MPAAALDFELTQFFAVTIGYPGQHRDGFLTVAGMNFNGIAGIRPNVIISDHISIQPSIGFGFPSIFGLFTSEKVVDIPFIGFIDVLYHFHFPGVFPYASLGLGYWCHFLKASSHAMASDIDGGVKWLFRPGVNFGIGVSFLSGLKLGTTFSIENFMGRGQHMHLMFDIDYPLF